MKPQSAPAINLPAHNERKNVKNFDDLPPQEKDEIHALAKEIQESARIQVLEHLVVAICETLDIKLDAKPVRDVLRQKQKDMAKEILRHSADVDATRVSQIIAYIDMCEKKIPTREPGNLNRQQ